MERKCQAVCKYWTQKSQEYYAQSDDALEMDSQDERDHKCQPTIPAAIATQLPPQRR